MLLPHEMNVGSSPESLIEAIYGEECLSGGVNSDEFLRDRSILSLQNDDVNHFNGLILDQFLGTTQTYLSVDSTIMEDGADNGNRYPTEYLNSLSPNGLPLSKLKVYTGCPIMLLRNISPLQGLCNGSRLVVLRLSERVIEARVLTRDCKGNVVFIPRNTLSSSTVEIPFKFQRRQVPVKVAYAMTINKAQGQSLKMVGIDLRSPVFSHGQFYVALSRCTHVGSIKVIYPETNEVENTVINIVYPEVLLH